jgi:sugar phosphate isomerase/epimerase
MIFNEDEFALMCTQINQVIDAMGSKSRTKEVSQGERLNRIPLAKGLYYTKDLSKGHIITKNDFKLFSPCVGIQAKELVSYLGKELINDVSKDTPAIPSHFSNSSIILNRQSLGNFGLPVRFRDIKEIKKIFEPTFIEYHMFASDLQVNPYRYKDLFDGFQLSIHAPEQFDDGFVLDLVSDNEDIFLESFERFKNVLSWVNSLQEINNSKEIKLITNVGGATNNADDRYKLNKKLAYEKLAEVADFAKSSGRELLPQTMPPYPWHFGGQGFHRLFVDLKDLEEMQSYYPMMFCMDVSHTWMSMAELGLNFYEEIFKYQKYFNYYHIADAKHPTDEGVQIGLGEIEFERISNLFKQKPGQYIPEVWNGHLDNFKGFKEALKQLETL